MRAALPKLMLLTETPVQGPVDAFALRNVPIATAILETDVSTQRVIVALDETYDRNIAGMSTVSVDFQEIRTMQNDMNLAACILFKSEDPDVDECVYMNPTPLE